MELCSGIRLDMCFPCLHCLGPGSKADMGLPKRNKDISCGMTSARTDILGRYGKFFSGLGVSMEVRVLSNMVFRDLQSTTAKNLMFVRQSSSVDPWEASPHKLREGLIDAELVAVERQDEWMQNQDARHLVLDEKMKYLQNLIDGLAI